MATGSRHAARAARTLKALALAQLVLCVIPLSLTYAAGVLVLGVVFTDAGAHALRGLFATGLGAAAGLLLLVALVRLLRPLWQGRRPHAVQLVAVVLLLTLCLPMSGVVLAHGAELLTVLALCAAAWAWRRGYLVWPALLMGAMLLLLFWAPAARIALPGAGLLALWLLVLRIDAYTLDRIPPLVWFGLALGVFFTVSGFSGGAVLAALTADAWLSALGKLYWGGGGALLCVATGLAAVWMGRRALADEEDGSALLEGESTRIAR